MSRRVGAAARAAGAACVAAAAACATSPEPHRAALADAHYGTYGALRLRDGRRHAGELLDVGDSTLTLLLGSERVAVARLADVEGVAWGRFRTYPWTGRVLHAPDLRALGRLASRFPYGMPPVALATLLARAGQTAPDTLRVGAP